MPAGTFTVDVNPAVLSWARESAGYSVREVAQRFNINESAVAAWESGQPQPTWSDLRKLAKVYGRPVASLLLAAPPEEAPSPTDYRRLPDSRKGLSPKTRFATRTVRWLLRRARELEQQLGVQERFQRGRVRLSDDPVEVARDLRCRFGVAIEQQTRWRSSSEALRQWRRAVEAQHVFVFQFKARDDDVSGFSHLEEDYPAIALNETDAVNRRIFTLLHEYAHLLIALPGVCFPEEGQFERTTSVEDFCDRVAAEFLVPRDDLEVRFPPAPTDGAVTELTERYRVSRYVVLGRMRTLGRVSKAAYWQIRRRWEAQAELQVPPKRTRGGGPSPVNRCLRQRGRLFVSAVLEAARREYISASDVTSYLGIRLKDYGELVSNVK